MSVSSSNSDIHENTQSRLRSNIENTTRHVFETGAMDSTNRYVPPGDVKSPPRGEVNESMRDTGARGVTHSTPTADVPYSNPQFPQTPVGSASRNNYSTEYYERQYEIPRADPWPSMHVRAERQVDETYADVSYAGMVPETSVRDQWPSSYYESYSQYPSHVSESPSRVQYPSNNSMSYDYNTQMPYAPYADRQNVWAYSGMENLPCPQNYSPPIMNRQDSQYMINPQPRLVKQKVLTPETFSGTSTTEWSDYIIHFEQIAAWNGCSEQQKAQMLVIQMRDEAQKFVCGLSSSQTCNYEVLKFYLKQRFNPQERELAYRCESKTFDSCCRPVMTGHSQPVPTGQSNENVKCPVSQMKMLNVINR